MSNSTPSTPPADEQASGMGANEHLDEFVEWDDVPCWDSKKGRIAVWSEKITVRDLVERVPEVGSEEAVDATAEALIELMNFWPTLEEMTKGRGIWLTSVPPLLREFLCLDFSPRYPEMLEAMRRLRFSVRMSLGGWVAAEELISDSLWERRMAEIRIRQRHHFEWHRKDP